jgi:hypothetical protein
MFEVVDGRPKLIYVRGRLFPADGNWYEWRQDPPLPAAVLVRVAAVADGRLVLTGLRVEGEPTAQVLRSIPVGRIEAAANAQLTVVDDAVVPTAVLPRRRPASHQSQASAQGWDTTSPARAQVRPAGPARTALELAQQRDLAEANGVPVSTTHRWIKEARHRGFLPPGRPGKAG